jgi:hypothetical protein
VGPIGPMTSYLRDDDSLWLFSYRMPYADRHCEDESHGSFVYETRKEAENHYLEVFVTNLAGMCKGTKKFAEEDPTPKNLRKYRFRDARQAFEDHKYLLSEQFRSRGYMSSSYQDMSLTWKLNACTS